MKNRYLFLLILIMGVQTLFAQRQRVIDSLHTVLNQVKTKKEKVDILILLADRYHSINPSEGIIHGDKALSLIGETGWEIEKIKAYRALGMCKKMQGNLSEAFQYFFQSLAISEQKSLEDQSAYTKRHIASAYKAQRNKVQSLKYYEEIRDYFEKTGDKNNLSIVLIDMGGLHSDHGELKEAKHYYETAFEIEKNRKSQTRIPVVVGNLGNIYGAEGNYKKAMELYEEARNLAVEVKDEREEAVNYGRIGFEYLNFVTDTTAIPKEYKIGGTREEHINKAVENIEKAVSYFKDTEQINIYHVFIRALPEAYFLAGQHEKGIEAFKEYYESKENANNKQREHDLARTELNYEYVRKKDSLRMEQEKKELLFQTEMQLKEMQHEYEKEQQAATTEKEHRELQFKETLKRQEIEATFKQKQAEAQAESKRKMQKIWIVSGTVFFMLVLFYFIRAAQFAMKKARLEKSYSENLVKSVEEERKRIAGELHDSVGQGLLLIKNKMFVSQKEDAGLVDNVIKEIRGISQSLHPYQFEKIGLIRSISNMVESLQTASDIFFSFDNEDQNIEKYIHPDKRIHIYRMVQESINNVLKHSGAKACRIAVYNEKNDICFDIKDNGKGFDLSQGENQFNSLGMKTLKGRATVIDAKLTIDSSPQKGTYIQIKVIKEANVA
ncbi:MAG: tetratricopeptide repeat protein [Flavobacteriaceae bacterium]|nr:tetratricopeptide repeat protein [Flavobacteriaceae bacterium]